MDGKKQGMIQPYRLRLLKLAQKYKREDGTYDWDRVQKDRGIKALAKYHFKLSDDIPKIEKQVEKGYLKILEPKNHPLGVAPKKFYFVNAEGKRGFNALYDEAWSWLLRRPLPFLAGLQLSEPGGEKEESLLEHALRSQKGRNLYRTYHVTKSMLKDLLKSMMGDIRQMSVEDLRLWSKVRKPRHGKPGQEERIQEKIQRVPISA